jgi:hypothetical protein
LRLLVPRLITGTKKLHVGMNGAAMHNSMKTPRGIAANRRSTHARRAAASNATHPMRPACDCGRFFTKEFLMVRNMF